MSDTERSLRAVLDDLIEIVKEYDQPSDPADHARWYDKWYERILSATGYHRLQKENQRHLGTLFLIEDVLWPPDDPDKQWSPDDLDEIAVILDSRGYRL